ncbi:MAG TPA: NlpC/P60 family protein [Campylobacterales bacterium]|nr:NlpC/P60 family protein [Campylobacterales bacterium]
MKLYKKYLIFIVIILTTIFPNAQDFDYFENITLEEAIAIEEVAKTHLGTKYVWGGNGKVGYDCSSFTQEVFEQNGIKIPRNSWKQAEVGKKIKKRDLKKGDLIFFNSKKQKRVNHVGIYLGNGKFIHASRFHKKIVISPLREYRRYFKWGRRLT